MKVLIADDSVSARTILENVLIENSFEVVSVENGLQAWREIEKGEVQLAILDWMMPGIDGIEICKRLHERNSARWVYVLLLTSKTGIDHITRALESGASDYVTKPFCDSELIARLRVGERIVKLQAQVNQMQKMKSIGQLAAGIAHEINSPIQFLNDNTEFLRSSFSDLMILYEKFDTLLKGSVNTPQPSMEHEKLHAIVETTDLDFLIDEVPAAINDLQEGLNKVANLVMIMKSFSKPSGDRKTSADLKRIIADSIALVKNDLDTAAELELSLDTELPLCSCYPNELGQVVFHLLLNAIQAIREKRLTAGEHHGVIRISSKAHGHWIEFEIRDNGCGIAREIADRIYDPFFSTKAVGEGSGLGLTIVHDVVAVKHSGHVSFVSAPESGTIFTVRLPQNQ